MVKHLLGFYTQNYELVWNKHYPRSFNAFRMRENSRKYEMYWFKQMLKYVRIFIDNCNTKLYLCKMHAELHLITKIPNLWHTVRIDITRKLTRMDLNVRKIIANTEVHASSFDRTNNIVFPLWLTVVGQRACNRGHPFCWFLLKIILSSFHVILSLLSWIRI